MVNQLAVRIIARVGAALAQAVVLLIVARQLGPELFADFALVASFVGLGYVAANMGVPSLALRVGDGRLPSVRDADLLWLGVGAIGASLLLGLAAAVSIGLDPSVVVVGGALLVSSDLSVEVVAAVMSGRGRIGRASALIISRRTLVSLAFLASIPFLKVSEAVVVCAVIGYVPMLIALLRAGTPDLLRMRLLLTSSRPYWRASASAQIIALDVPIVRFFGGPEIGGIYAAAVRTAAPLLTLPASLLGVLVPKLSREDIQDQGPLIRRTRWLGVALAVGCVLMAPVMGIGAQALLGESYRGAMPVVVALVCGIGLSCLSQVLLAQMFASDQADSAAVAITVGSVFGLAILGSALWVGGAQALPFAALGTQVCVLVAMWLMLHRPIDLWRSNKLRRSSPERDGTRVD